MHSPPLLLLGAVASTLLACGADSRPASWDYISPVIMQPNCATTSCHSRAAAVAGLDFSDPDRGYISLTGLKVWVVDPGGKDGCMNMAGVVVCQRNFRPLVTPYNPEQSRLINMLRARGASRMPPDRPLSEPDIRLIERWIRNGALKTGPRDDAAAGEGGRDAGPSVTVTVTPPDGAEVHPADAGDGAQPGDAA